eukprot:COSAG06_NODE_50445_length_318_cov_1.283105_1_plen_27_part_10
MLDVSTDRLFIIARADAACVHAGQSSA